MTAHFVLLLSLTVLLDFATPIVPVGQTFEWDDEEEVTHVRRSDTRRRLTRVSPAPRLSCVPAIRTNHFPIPAVQASDRPREWLIPLRQSHLATPAFVSSPEDH